MSSLIDKFQQYLYIPILGTKDFVEIFILAMVVYIFMGWVKDTKAWTLIKGLFWLFLCYIGAYIFDLTTIVLIFEKAFNLLFIGFFIIFQPELRKALEEIGNKNLTLGSFFPKKENDNLRFSSKTIHEIVESCKDMSKAKTGALILIEGDILLDEYKKTGIDINADISSQLITNIFEHNTPLHDGAMIISNDKIVSATCYLPLTHSTKIQKSLGTRHRAGIGVSEEADCLVIIVSEETGNISLVQNGILHHNVSIEDLNQRLRFFQEDKNTVILHKKETKKEEILSWIKSKFSSKK